MFVLHCYQLLILLAVAGLLAAMMVNLSAFRTLRAPRSPVGPQPRISVLVPARNEERSIGECLASLQRQDYPDFEVILLDDESSDRTAAIARELGFRENGTLHRLIRGEPLPVGWTGKSWACHQLARAASGEYLLFTDADTVYAPGALAAGIHMVRETRASLLSAWPRLVTRTWGEKLVVPLLHVLGFGLYPHAAFQLIQDSPASARLLGPGWRRALGAANGQFLLFDAAAYRAMGGHETVRTDVVEDVALGREVAARIGEGMRLVNCDGARFVDCRMYRSFPEVWQGFSKNLRAAFAGSLAGFIATGAVLATCLLFPFLFLAAPGGDLPLILAQVALIYLGRAILAIRFRTSFLGVILHPVGLALALAIALNSWRLTTGEGVVWKGRRYLGRDSQ